MKQKNLKCKLLIYSLLIFFLLGNISLVSSLIIKRYVSNPLYQELMYVSIQLIIAYLALNYTKRIYNLKHNNNINNIKTGLFKYGIIIWVYIVGIFLYAYIPPEKNLIEAIPNILVTLIVMVGVGIYEELLFRVLLINSFEDFFSKNKKGIILSLSISSIIFGLMHLYNLINYKGAIILILSQVIYAIMIGFTLAVLYYITNNIIICITFHTLIDFASNFWRCLINATQTANDITIINGLIYILLFMPMIIVSMMQLKKRICN